MLSWDEVKMICTKLAQTYKPLRRHGWNSDLK